jgi:hypothetical protein
MDGDCNEGGGQNGVQCRAQQLQYFPLRAFGKGIDIFLGNFRGKRSFFVVCKNSRFFHNAPLSVVFYTSDIVTYFLACRKHLAGGNSKNTQRKMPRETSFVSRGVVAR